MNIYSKIPFVFLARL